MSPFPRSPLLVLLILSAGLPPPEASAQAVRQGPFAGVRAFGEAAEVVTLTDRIFVRVESQGGESELRADNNLGFARLPGIAVPEPEAGMLGLAAIAALGLLRWRRSGGSR